MIRLARTSEDWPRRSRWPLWRFNSRNITPERKVEYALLEVGGPAANHVLAWAVVAVAVAWVILENLL